MRLAAIHFGIGAVVPARTQPILSVLALEALVWPALRFLVVWTLEAAEVTLVCIKAASGFTAVLKRLRTLWPSRANPGFAVLALGHLFFRCRSALRIEFAWTLEALE